MKLVELKTCSRLYILGRGTSAHPQARRLRVGKTTGVDFDTRQSVSRQQLHRRWKSKQSICFAAVNVEPKAILLLLHEEGAEHTGGVEK